MSLSLTDEKADPFELEMPQYTAQELLDALSEVLAEEPVRTSTEEARREVSLRTLHYYINIGLLPGPDRKGRSARYSRDHLNRLLLIKRLQDVHMPLGVIKQNLQKLTAVEVQEQLSTLPTPASEGGEGGAPGEAEPRPPPPSAPADPSAAPGSAADYIARVLATQGRVNAAVREKGEDVSSPSPPAPDVSLMNVSMSRPMAYEELDTGRQSWERIELAPGVELHVRQAESTAVRRKIDQLVAYAGRLFGRRSS
jgi:DNA-binding transcriptional MerR regulator